MVYALSNKIQDPLQADKIEYEWFKFMHTKQHINKVNPIYENDNYLYPLKVKNKLYIGGYRQDRIVHYYNKALPKELHARIF